MTRDVLDRNLELLLKRAYVPVVPAPVFAERLLLELAQRQRRPSARMAQRGPVLRPLLRAAATLLVLAGIAWIATLVFRGAPTALDKDAILADGRCAARTGAEDWRALDTAEAERGVEHSGGALEVATPESAKTRLWFGAEGSAAFESSTHVTADFRAVEHALDLVLHAGAVAVERLASGGAWRIETAQGRFELDRGLLELAYVGPEFADGRRAIRARLVVGAAIHVGTDARTALVVGRAYVARGGVLRDVEVETSFSGDPGERTLATSPAPETGVATDMDPSARRARLVLRVSTSKGRAPVTGGTATILRQARLPSIGQPMRRTIDPADGVATWVNVAPGAYEVFVDVPGHGTWRTNDLLLAEGDDLTLPVVLEHDGARVRGRVIDASTGAPIEGAQILSETDAPTAVIPFDLDADPDVDLAGSRSVARTGPDGSFELDGLSVGRHVLRAWASGRGAEWSAPLDLAAAREPAELVFRLAPGGTVEGRILDERGKPRTNARMIVSRIDFGAPRRVISYSMSETDPEGRFGFADLAGGLYSLLAFLEPEPIPSMRQIVVRAGETLRVDLPGAEVGATLRGRLVHADGRAAANVDVSIQRSGSRGMQDYRNERTDAEGRFAFHGLPAEPHELYAGLELGSRLTSLGELDVPEVNEFQREFVLHAHTIEGVVRDDRGQPCLNTAVILEREHAGEYRFASRSVTDGQGAWRADFLEPGRWRACVYSWTEGLAPVLGLRFELRADAQEPKRLDFDLQRGARLVIRLRDAAGAPVRGADVTFEDEHGIAWEATIDDSTDANGLLQVPGFGTGAWTVRVFREGFARAEAPVRLEAGDDRELTIELAPAGTNK